MKRPSNNLTVSLSATMELGVAPFVEQDRDRSEEMWLAAAKMVAVVENPHLKIEMWVTRIFGELEGANDGGTGVFDIGGGLCASGG